MSAARRVRSSLLVGLTLVSGCYQRREIERRDWPNLPVDRAITVRTLSGAEHRFETFAFTTAGLLGRTPVDSLARVDSTLIPLDSIAVVRVSELNRGGTLMLVAAAVTATFIIMAQGESDVRPAPEPAPSSCPFIYSWDGRDWVFDGETYAGAVARALERSDTDELEAIRPVAGRYRIRVRNERRETDYTDELAFLVVDHAPGTKAVSDRGGRVHVVAHATAPLGTREYGGDTIPSRAGWELAFARPPGDTAALVLRVRNTPVGPFALYHTLSLLGSGVYTWYGALDKQPITRWMVQSWVEREGHLDVQVRQGDNFTSVARIPDVGAAISKNETVLLDLRGFRGDTVRVRLESSPQLWVLEDARLATYRGPAHVQQLAAVAARDEAGRDVAPLLAERDGRYLVTTRGSDVAMEYVAPPSAAGTTRTVLVRTTGHYYVETDDRAAPRMDIVERLMRDRAFAQQYFADAWERAGHAPLPGR